MEKTMEVNTLQKIRERFEKEFRDIQLYFQNRYDSGLSASQQITSFYEKEITSLLESLEGKVDVLIGGAKSIGIPAEYNSHDSTIWAYKDGHNEGIKKVLQLFNNLKQGR